MFVRPRIAPLTSFLLAVALPLAAQQQDLSTVVGSLAWREIGPTIMGGRISDIAVVESHPATFYVGTATGGVWKTTNAGTTFEPVFTDQATSSIGDVTVAPSNPNVVWVGTGEPQNRQSSPWGNGVYLSRDGGRTWMHRGLEATHHIARIQVHPTNPDVAFVAAVGHLWGANAERGVYRTTDGGETWEKVLFVDELTGAIDLVMDPGDPQTLFAAMYQRQRKAWGYNGGGPGSGIYRTLDGGDTWVELTEGLPEGDKGRIGLDVYRRDGNLVYAIVEADAQRPGQGFGGGGGRRGENGVYRSTDRGETWEKVSDTNNRPMYYSQIRIDPNDPERIYTGGSDLFRSSDGGRTFTNDAAEGVHLDHHALWIDPNNSEHLLLGSDGGVSYTWDRGENWVQLRNLPVSQFYEVGFDMREPYHVCGGLQDNGSWCAPSDTWSNQGIRTRDWYNIGSGDGFFAVMHPTRPVLFAESQGGNLTRVDLVSNERARIRPVDRPSATDADREFRWNWNTPVVLSSHDANTIYIGGNVLFRSRDMGQSWEEVSPDLTYAIDRETLEIMGVKGSAPQISLNDGQSSYGNLTAIAESPVDAEVLYTGSDDGRIQGTRDGGATWTDLTPNVRGLPANTYVTRIVASAAAAGTVWAAFDGHRDDDFHPYVYASDDYGRTWRSVAQGLPDVSVNALVQHPRTHDLWFVGNELGIWFSPDAGAHWHALNNNLPTVPVDDIEIHPRDNDLIIGTHGRGIWIMADVAPLEGLSQTVMASALHAFPVRPAISYNLFTPQGWTPGIWVAENAPQGAYLRYWVGAPAMPANGSSGPGANGDPMAGDSVTVEIRDGSGAVVRTLKGGAGAGVQQVVWDLRMDPPYVPERGAGGGGGGGGFFGGAPSGPRVLPGTYRVRMALGDASSETEVQVRLDPRIQISSADLAARQAALLSGHALQAPLYEAGQAVNRLREQLGDARGQLDEHEGSPQTLKDEVKALTDSLDAINEDLGEVRGNSRAGFSIEASTAAPTADQLWQLDQAWEAAPAVIERINRLVTERMPALYRQLNEQGIRPDPGQPVAIPRRPGR